MIAFTRAKLDIKEALDKVLSKYPERVWSIGALYDEVRAKLSRPVTLRAVTSAVEAYVKEHKLVVSWQTYGIRNYRLRSSLD